MEPTTGLNRRNFLLNTAAAVGGLYVAFHVASPLQRVFAADAPAAAPLTPNAFIRIAPNNDITIVINRLEMGQGVNTSMAQLIAEELECDWQDIKSVASNSDAVYNDPMFHMIMTGGSTSLKNSWDQYRNLGAGMKEMLLQAAAKRWNVPVSELKAVKGTIVHAKKGSLTYGELADEANKLDFPKKPNLKNKKDYKVIGHSFKRVDATDKANGKAIFGMDVRLPGLQFVAIARPPIFSAKLKSFNEKAALAIKGVTEVMKIGDNKVAVVARNSYLAKLGQEALDAKWDLGDHAKVSTDGLMNEFRQLAQKKGIVAAERGDADAQEKNAITKISSEYEFPFLSHASMEPMNCTIDFDGKKADLYGGFQMPTLDHVVVAKTLGIAHDQIKFNITYAGGSFGRRGNKDSDYILEACQVAKILKKPIKIVWTREDDMHGGYYRPMVFHKVTIGLDKKNDLASWNHHIVGQSISKGSVMEGFMIKNGVESALVEGVSDSHYDIKNARFEQTMGDTPFSTSWWRSVGHTHTAYVMETMIDELAHAGKKDELELRKSLLKKSPKHIAVLDLLKKKTNWGKAKAPKGRAWGMAIHESFDTVVAHMAEVSITDNIPKVHKVWTAVHCGQVVNPQGAATQVEGAIVLGLSAAFHQQIEFKDGAFQQSNFDDYDVLRMQDMPVVSVSFVETSDAPTGLGEPGVPPIAPAVANAIFKLNGKRLRKLPFSRELQA